MVLEPKGGQMQDTRVAGRYSLSGDDANIVVMHKIRSISYGSDTGDQCWMKCMSTPQSMGEVGTWMMLIEVVVSPTMGPERHNVMGFQQMGTSCGDALNMSRRIHLAEVIAGELFRTNSKDSDAIDSTEQS